MLNDEYEPTGKHEEAILDCLRGRGRTRPTCVANELGVGRPALNHHLKRLAAAGWIDQPQYGLYEYRCDPREMSEVEIAAVHIDHAVTLTDTEAVVEYLLDRVEASA